MTTIHGMSNDVQGQITELHAAWNRLTGQNLRMLLCDYEKEYAYQQFIKAGFTRDDLYIVITYLQREIKKGNRLSGALRWSNCMANLTRFDEDLQLARAEKRRFKPVTPRDRIAQQWHPTVAEPKVQTATAKPVSDIALEVLRKFKEEQFGTRQ